MSDPGDSRDHLSLIILAKLFSTYLLSINQIQVTEFSSRKEKNEKVMLSVLKEFIILKREKIKNVHTLLLRSRTGQAYLRGINRVV